EQAKVLDELTALAGTAGAAAADVARRRAWLAAHTDRYTAAEEEAARALDLAEDDASRAAALAAMGTARCWRGNHDGAVTALRAAIETHPAAAGRAQA
ncbi:hypothetical protein, partial [Salmonella enterica]|uniref:hypothetical protein n=1 Tax=Salmonella enterica TaxID=28901 RepID=UPI003296C58E